MNFKNKKKGFTLIELLVVIAIIGLLATLAVVALGNARQKSRDAKRVSDIKQVQTALELRYVDEDSYPTDAAAAADNELGIDYTCIVTTGLATGAGCTGTTYMGLIPSDPSGGAAPCASGGVVLCNYVYDDDGLGNTDYQIHFYLEGNTGGLTGNVTHCASPNGISNSGTCS